MPGGGFTSLLPSPLTTFSIHTNSYNFNRCFSLFCAIFSVVFFCLILGLPSSVLPSTLISIACCLSIFPLSSYVHAQITFSSIVYVIGILSYSLISYSMSPSLPTVLLKYLIFFLSGYFAQNRYFAY